MAYLLALLPLPLAFLAESLPLRIMCVFIALLILFFVRESRASKDRPSEFSQIRFKSENPDEDDEYEFFMDRFWQTQMAQKKEVTGDPIYLNSVDVNEIKREARNPHHNIDGPRLNLSMVDLVALKAEIARQMAESQGIPISLDMISAEDLRAEIAFEIAQERALQSYDSTDVISLSSVDVNAIKATPLEINNAITRLQQKKIQDGRIDIQDFNFRSRQNEDGSGEIGQVPIRVEQRQQPIIPVRVPLREVDHTIYPDDNMYRNIATPIAGPKTSKLFNQYRIKPESTHQEDTQNYTQASNHFVNDYASNSDFRDQNFDPRLKQQNSFRYDEIPTIQDTRADMQFVNWQDAQNPHMGQQQRVQRMQVPQQQISQQHIQRRQNPQTMQMQQQVPRTQNPQTRQIQQQRQQDLQQPTQMQQQRVQSSQQPTQMQQQRVQSSQQPTQMQQQRAQDPQHAMQMQLDRLQRLQEAQSRYIQEESIDELQSMPTHQASRTIEPIQMQQQVMYVEPVVPAKAKNMEMAHALRMELIRRQREEAMQKKLAYQSEMVPFNRTVDRRKIDIPVVDDRRNTTRRIQSIPVRVDQREQMSPVDIANENRKIMEMQGEKLRSMQDRTNI